MDNKIEVFKNEQFGEVRTILEGETLLFCGSDVARALGYAEAGGNLCCRIYLMAAQL